MSLDVWVICGCVVVLTVAFLVMVVSGRRESRRDDLPPGECNGVPVSPVPRHPLFEARKTPDCVVDAKVNAA